MESILLGWGIGCCVYILIHGYGADRVVAAIGIVASVLCLLKIV